jgi:DNA-binding XRE family transcriptional regulator
VKGRKHSFFETMPTQRTHNRNRFANDIRIHRRRTGLSQRDVGEVLGYFSEGPVARHEDGRRLPSLDIAIGYELIFHVPVSEIFAGLRDELDGTVDTRLAQLEERLGQYSAKDRNAMAVARKLTWLSERKTRNIEPVP